MKHLLLTTIAAVVLMGCATTESPVSPTAKAPDLSIHTVSEEGNIEAVKQHLAAGTDVDAGNEDASTPLHYAVAFSHKETAELLIANGADVNAKDMNGRTPLHWAAFERHNQIVELLIANGADVNAKDNEGKTPLYFAELTRHKETADLLRKHGAKTSEDWEPSSGTIPKPPTSSANTVARRVKN